MRITRWHRGRRADVEADGQCPPTERTGSQGGEEVVEPALAAEVPLYSRALSTGLPFPKTRRIVFLENQPATLPGWVALEVG